MNNSDMRLQAFLQGTNYTSQDYFGVHEQEDGYVFRVWAPRAAKVMLTGDFNEWRDDLPLVKTHDSGIWEISLPFGKICEGSRYKYRIYGCGQLHYKFDPYALSQAPSPDNSSIVYSKNQYVWKDRGWLEYRKRYQKNIQTRPVNIYEVHLGSWKKRDKRSYLNYRDYARELAPYVKQMGYTHICLLPITEYSDVSSAGYAPSSLFAPASKYGSADDLKAFVDKMHEAGIGVIFDLPILKMPIERYGLFEFDGAPLYEIKTDGDEDKRERRFDISKREVQSFLASSVLYWISEYHADGIRISRVDELLGAGSENKEDKSEQNNIVASFLSRILKFVKKSYSDVLTVAQGDIDVNIGFDLMVNSTWSQRLLEYANTDFLSRGERHTLITELLNSNGDRTVAVSHTDVCYGKCSYIEANSGDYWQKFAGARALLGLMMTMRSKKLLFMGSEIAQFREWDYDRETEWFLLDYESHEKFQRYVAELNNFYLSHPSLWQWDAYDKGFYFVDKDCFSQSVIIFRRNSSNEELTVVVNLTPNAYEDFRIGAHSEGSFVEIFNSDALKFYGSGVVNTSEIVTERQAYHGYKNSIRLRVPPLGITVLRFKSKIDKKSKVKSK